MTVKELITLFDTAEAEALAVVEAGDRRHAIGLLTEAHARRRVRMLEPRLGDAQRGGRNWRPGLVSRSSWRLS